MQIGVYMRLAEHEARESAQPEISSGTRNLKSPKQFTTLSQFMNDTRRDHVTTAVEQEFANAAAQ